MNLVKKYSITTLKYIRQFYEFAKSHSLSDRLTFTHYKVMLLIKDDNKLNYYINSCINNNLSVRQLSEKIKSNEFERLPEDTKNKLINEEQMNIQDMIPSPIIIKNINNVDVINEKALQKLILENISSFLKELGNGFTFIDNEYKIKVGNKFNYIDLLLFNIEYNCYVVIELKVTELKKDHIGQIQFYMNYINDNIKKPTMDNTIGIILVRKNDGFIMEYCSDDRILSKEYLIT